MKFKFGKYYIKYIDRESIEKNRKKSNLHNFKTFSLIMIDSNSAKSKYLAYPWQYPQ
jgi:hypothetical protein